MLPLQHPPQTAWIPAAVTGAHSAVCMYGADAWNQTVWSARGRGLSGVVAPERECKPGSAFGVTPQGASPGLPSAMSMLLQGVAARTAVVPFDSLPRLSLKARRRGNPGLLLGEA